MGCSANKMHKCIKWLLGKGFYPDSKDDFSGGYSRYSLRGLINTLKAKCQFDTEYHESGKVACFDFNSNDVWEKYFMADDRLKKNY